MDKCKFCEKAYTVVYGKDNEKEFQNNCQCVEIEDCECPFCGNTEFERTWVESEEGEFIQCRYCEGRGPRGGTINTAIMLYEMRSHSSTG